jgi:hypothetical protein
MNKQRSAAWLASITLLAASAVIAAEPPTADATGPSKEIRDKLATLHEQLANCLRSDKPIAQCHTEMMKSCQDMFGAQGCPMLRTQDHMSRSPAHSAAPQ